MPTAAHKRAEELAGRADLLARAGNHVAARELYRAAADAEQEAVLQFTATDKPRTFSILAVSHASLLFKAKALELASQAPCRYLGESDLSARGRTQLKELLQVIWDEQLVEEEGLQYSGEELWFSLRGGEIGSGTAPVDTAIHFISTANHLVWRAVEWTARFPLRLAGLPDDAVRRAMQARATQPVVGSYRFSVRLLKQQLELFPDSSPASRINPSEIATFVVEFLKAVSRGNVDAVESVVPEPGYRRALLQLTRNLLPSESKQVGEVEVSRLSEGRAESAVLLEGAREQVSAALRVVNPALQENAKEERGEIVGILRALHLDDNWLLVKPDNEDEAQRCLTREDVLDDVVGPMVNKRVRIVGHWEMFRGRKVFRLEDIDFA